jgi:hypothetical protein
MYVLNLPNICTFYSTNLSTSVCLCVCVFLDPPIHTGLKQKAGSDSDIGKADAKEDIDHSDRVASVAAALKILAETTSRPAADTAQPTFKRNAEKALKGVQSIMAALRRLNIDVPTLQYTLGVRDPLNNKAWHCASHPSLDFCTCLVALFSFVSIIISQVHACIIFETVNVIFGSPPVFNVQLRSKLGCENCWMF